VSGTATDLAVASILSAALGEALYETPFKSFYAKILKDRSNKFEDFGIRDFFF
jgi:hypothetical protein